MKRRRSTIGMMFYEALKPFFLKHYYYELSRPVEFRDLTPVFTDGEYQYYEFPDSTALPVERLMQQSYFMNIMASGIDENNLMHLIGNAKEFMEAAIENTGDKKTFAKNAAKTYAILEDIERRSQEIFPIDVFINVLCCMIVRNDENPVKFNPEIHREKCDYFIDHVDDYGFFFQSAAFRSLSEQYKLSEEKWRKKLSDWVVSQMQAKRSSKIFSTDTKATEPQRKKKSSF